MSLSSSDDLAVAVISALFAIMAAYGVGLAIALVRATATRTTFMHVARFAKGADRRAKQGLEREIQVAVVKRSYSRATFHSFHLT